MSFVIVLIYIFLLKSKLQKPKLTKKKTRKSFIKLENHLSNTPNNINKIITKNYSFQSLKLFSFVILIVLFIVFIKNLSTYIINFGKN